MNFRKANNITGWAVFLIALATYMLTREARGSLWDCGEFVASADKVQLPHPPGAPLFVLLGRFFIILFGDNKMTAANAVNFMSAFASAATILFLFWSITHFARKMFVSVGEQLSGQQLFTTMAAGVVGALAYTFSDSFWFSAVEGEVYALSSFFTALVFWAMLKWEHADEHAGADLAARERADRWIVFLFFMVGLSIGVHLLNLLSIPAIVMIYYFRRHFKYDPFKSNLDVFKKDQMVVWTAIATFGLVVLLILANLMNRDSDLIGVAMALGFIGALIILVKIYWKYKAIRELISAFAIGCLITGIVQVIAIQYSMKAAGLFDVFFVNTVSLPFFSGFTIYFLAVSAVIVWALRFNDKNISRGKLIAWFLLFLGLSTLPFFAGAGSGGAKVLKFLLVAGVATLIGYYFKPSGLRILRLSLWCYAFLLIGYFVYFTALIRSNANPAIDMNNVDNPISLVYYLSREQYGSAPIVYGPHIGARYKEDPSSPNGIDMKKGEMKYLKGKDSYIPTGTADEPRFRSEDQQIFPRIWDKSNDQNHLNFYIQWLNLEQKPDEDGRPMYAPTYFDNFNWFFTYQMDLMYWRYFMWNFAGKQNDIQGLGNVRDGNWVSGISFIDNGRLGDQSKMPDSLKDNKAHNKLYMLPFILGMVGFVYQMLKNRKDWFVTFLLFFMTGIAVVIYLNQPGNQPRERDYAYVGSFYAFAIWIGLAVVAFVKLAREKADKKLLSNVLVYGSVLTLAIAVFSCVHKFTGGAIVPVLAITLLYALVTAGIIYLVRALSSGGKNGGVLNLSASVICLIVPLMMAQQEWDDHDRSSKLLAPDLARDYLESCAPNAIIITFGDNDTYPLWYAQEVEGVRPDIRIINNSLLGIDWYINQLRYKINQADSVDVVWSPEQIQGDKRNYVVYDPKNFPQTQYANLYDMMKNYVGSDKEETMDFTRGEPLNTFPVTKVSVPVDRELVLKNKTVNPDDNIVPELRFELPRRPLLKNDLIILNIIASNQWRRPIYFTTPIGELGFGAYFRKDGLAYRLVPVVNKFPQGNWEIERAIAKIEDSLKINLGGTMIRDNNNAVIFDNLMQKFGFGNAQKAGVYFDEENRRHLLNIRSVFAEAAGNFADIGDKEKAAKLLDKAEAGISTGNLPYGMTSRFNSHNQTGLIYLEAAYKAGRTDLAEKVRKDVRKDLEQQRAYYNYLQAEQPDYFGGSLQGTEVLLNDVMLKVLEAIERRYTQTQATTPVEGRPNTIQTDIKPKTDSPGTKVDSPARN